MAFAVAIIAREIIAANRTVERLNNEISERQELIISANRARRRKPIGQSRDRVAVCLRRRDLILWVMSLGNVKGGRAH